MVVKIYISGISGNKEVKKRQQRVLMILDSKTIKYELVDIAEPSNEADKDYMQANSTSTGATIGDANPKYPLPPQIYNGADYCGDYDQFDVSNENDELDQFLKLSPDDMTVTSSVEVSLKTQAAPKKETEEPVETETENNEAEPAVKNGDDVVEQAESDEINESSKEMIEDQDNVENGENSGDH